MVCAVKVSGQQLLDALEWGARNTGLSVPGDPKSGESGGFLQVSGAKYTIHTEIPSTVEADAEGNWVKGPTGEYRVKDVMVYDRETGKYEELVEKGIGEDSVILAAYAKAFEKGGNEYPQISSAASPLQKYPGFGINYENAAGAGRITIVK